MKLVHTWVAIITMLLIAPPVLAAAQVDAADETSTGRLEAQLLHAHYARIGTQGRSYVLARPVVTENGLGYRKVEGFVRRPGMFRGEWDSISPPPNPMPWSSIERIEVGGRSHGRGAAIGAAVGFALGLLVAGGTAAAYSHAYGGGAEAGEVAGFILAGGGAFAVVGAGIGALGGSTRWRTVHPEKRSDP